jgi:hypothetical protein
MLLLHLPLRCYWSAAILLLYLLPSCYCTFRHLATVPASILLLHFPPSCCRSCLHIVTALSAILLPYLPPSCYCTFRHLITVPDTILFLYLPPSCYCSCYKYITFKEANSGTLYLAILTKLIGWTFVVYLLVSLQQILLFSTNDAHSHLKAACNKTVEFGAHKIQTFTKVLHFVHENVQFCVFCQLSTMWAQYCQRIIRTVNFRWHFWKGSLFHICKELDGNWMTFSSKDEAYPHTAFACLDNLNVRLCGRVIPSSCFCRCGFLCS